MGRITIRSNGPQKFRYQIERGTSEIEMIFWNLAFFSDFELENDTQTINEIADDTRAAEFGY